MRPLLTIVLVGLLLTGCASAPRSEPTAEDRPQTLDGQPDNALTAAKRRLSPFGLSREGATIPVIVLGNGPDTVLLIASIHGDEPAGTPLLFSLHAYLESHPEELRGRTVVLVPKANPDGFASASRENSAGVDLNRDFPASNRRAAAMPLEPETRALLAVIDAHTPDRVVSIHQPLRCVDFDGDGGQLAHAMSAACGLPVKRLGARSGSLGSYLGMDRGTPVITLELPGHAHSLDAHRLWDRYGQALIVAVRGH